MGSLNYKYMSNGTNLTNDLINASNQIYELRDERLLKNQRQVFEQNSFFVTEDLVRAFEGYKSALQKATEIEPDNKEDISDYINQDMMDKKLHVHFLNQFGGTMTGLGILGTFIGLSIGLAAFAGYDNQANVKEIANSIWPLLSGIQVAFHTSIIGLIYSLGFNFFYKGWLVDNHTAVEDYLNTFENYVVPLNEIGVAGSLLTNQRGQLKQQVRTTEMQRTMLEEERAIRYTVEKMPRYITSSMESTVSELVIPELKNMKNAFVDFSSAAYQNQQENMKVIVDAFLKEMNASLCNAFTELGGIVKETSEQQKASMLHVQSMMGKVEEVSVRADRMSAILGETVTKVSEIANAMENSQKTLLSYVRDVKEHTDAYSAILASEQNILEHVNTSEMQLQTAIRQMVDYLGSGQKATDEIVHKISELKLATEQFNTDVSSATEGLRSATVELGEKMDTRTSDTFRCFDEQMAVIMNHFSDVVEEMDETIAKMPAIVTEVYGDLDQKIDAVQTRINTL